MSYGTQRFCPTFHLAEPLGSDRICIQSFGVRYRCRGVLIPSSGSCSR